MVKDFDWWRDWQPPVGPWADRRVLRSWGGRPTLTVDRYEDHLVLGWMLMGHVEPIDIWLMMPLEDAEEEDLLRTSDHSLEDWMRARVGRPARLQLDVFSPGSAMAVPAVIAEWIILDGRDLIDAALQHMAQAVKGEIGTRRLQEELIEALEYLQQSLSVH